MLNLWNPGPGLPMAVALLTAFLLGMLHGITPDEHTWPITFSYSVGSYSTRGGLKAGILFSLSFTLQRAVAAELAWYALVGPLMRGDVQFLIYAVVGVVMVVAGAYILRLGRNLHLLGFLEHWGRREESADPRPVPLSMTLVHGFVAGWGTGAFAVLVYTVLVPAMPGPAVAFMPGLLFGLGTMSTQALFGAFFGRCMERWRLNARDKACLARRMSGRTLLWGGLVFFLVGLAGQFLPLGRLYVVTPIRVHNLHQLGVGFFLVVVALFGVAFWSLRRSVRELTGPSRG